MQNRSLLMRAVTSSFPISDYSQTLSKNLRLSKARKNSSDETECSICFEFNHESESASIDGCDHKFCFECIDTWRETKTECPLCRAKFETIEYQGREIDCFVDEDDQEIENYDELIDILEFEGQNGEIHTVATNAFTGDVEEFL